MSLLEYVTLFGDKFFTICVLKILSTVCADMVTKIHTKLSISFITKLGKKVVAKFVIVIVIVWMLILKAN